MKPLHHALRESRVRAGMTQMQAAEFSGIERGQIGDLETKAEGVTLKTLCKLAKCYGATLDELTGYTPEPEPRMNARERRAVNLLLSVMRETL